jgi:hypothetical protein
MRSLAVRRPKVDMDAISLTRRDLHRLSQFKTHHTSGLRNSKRSLPLHLR